MANNILKKKLYVTYFYSNKNFYNSLASSLKNKTQTIYTYPHFIYDHTEPPVLLSTPINCYCSVCLFPVKIKNTQFNFAIFNPYFVWTLALFYFVRFQFYIYSFRAVTNNSRYINLEKLI